MAETISHKVVDVSVAIILNKNNEVLLQKKDMGYSWFPGGWCLFGGGKEGGETPEETIRRELMEELPSVSLKDLRFFKRDNYQDKLPSRTRGGTRHCYVVPYSGTMAGLSVHEGAGLAFFSRDELKSIPLVDHDRQIILEFYQSH